MQENKVSNGLNMEYLLAFQRENLNTSIVDDDESFHYISRIHESTLHCKILTP